MSDSCSPQAGRSLLENKRRRDGTINTHSSVSQLTDRIIEVCLSEDSERGQEWLEKKPLQIEGRVQGNELLTLNVWSHLHGPHHHNYLRKVGKRGGGAPNEKIGPVSNEKIRPVSLSSQQHLGQISDNLRG